MSDLCRTCLCTNNEKEVRMSEDLKQDTINNKTLISNQIFSLYSVDNVTGMQICEMLEILQIQTSAVQVSSS